MAIMRHGDITEDLVSALGREIQAKVSEIAEPIIAEALAKIEMGVREKVGAVAAKIVGQLSYERMGTDLRITVHFPKSAIGHSST